MHLLNKALTYISEVAKIPSFSSYEERLHPYVRNVFKQMASDGIGLREIFVEGNSLIYHLDRGAENTVALTAHLDKINHYGPDYPDKLPVNVSDKVIEGAMDNSVGVGIILALASTANHFVYPNLLFFFSEMEESKGLKEHPQLLKNRGEGYSQGMGARQIASTCLAEDLIPELVITVDTTPLFKGEKGVALYSRHWKLNDLNPTDKLKERTDAVVKEFLSIDNDIKLDNNTNDYLHYGYEFNNQTDYDIVSVALEPAIYPYHQQGEKVSVEDIDRVLSILNTYLTK